MNARPDVDGTFNLRAVMREVLNDFGTSDRAAVAAAILRQIAPKDRDAALQQAVVEIVCQVRTQVPLRERLHRQTERVGECLIWRGKIHKGYGWISVGNRYMQVHRISYELATGRIPAGLVLDHTCHTRDQSCSGGPTCPHRACVNPEHLEPVTAVENSRRAAGRPLRRTRGPKREVSVT